MSISDELSDPKFLTALVGGAFGIASTVIPILDRWVRDRTAKERISQDLEQLTKRVAFWDAWFKAGTMVTAPDELSRMKATVQRELEELAVVYSSQPLLAARATFAAVQIVPKSAIRRLFLIYAPKRQIAWIPRVFFYVFSAYFLAAVAVLPKTGGIDDPLVWALLLLLVSFSWLFRYLSLRMQGPLGQA
jgi:hypothetical protein